MSGQPRNAMAMRRSLTKPSQSALAGMASSSADSELQHQQQHTSNGHGIARARRPPSKYTDDCEPGASEGGAASRKAGRRKTPKAKMGRPAASNAHRAETYQRKLDRQKAQRADASATRAEARAPASWRSLPDAQAALVLSNVHPRVLPLLAAVSKGWGLVLLDAVAMRARRLGHASLNTAPVLGPRACVRRCGPHAGRRGHRRVRRRRLLRRAHGRRRSRAGDGGDLPSGALGSRLSQAASTMRAHMNQFVR